MAKCRHLLLVQNIEYGLPRHLHVHVARRVRSHEASMSFTHILLFILDHGRKVLLSLHEIVTVILLQVMKATQRVTLNGTLSILVVYWDLSFDLWVLYHIDRGKRLHMLSSFVNDKPIGAKLVSLSLRHLFPLRILKLDFVNIVCE